MNEAYVSAGEVIHQESALSVNVKKGLKNLFHSDDQWKAQGSPDTPRLRLPLMPITKVPNIYTPSISNHKLKSIRKHAIFQKFRENFSPSYGEQLSQSTTFRSPCERRLGVTIY